MSKEEVIKQIAATYHASLRRHNFFPNFNQELAFYEKISNACTDHKPWEKYILMIETAYLAIPQSERKIIKCDFFYRNFSFWWEEENFVDKDEYLDAKEKAVNDFYGNLEKLRVIKKSGEINYDLFK